MKTPNKQRSKLRIPHACVRVYGMCFRNVQVRHTGPREETDESYKKK